MRFGTLSIAFNLTTSPTPDTLAIPRLGGSRGNNFVRIDCPLNVTEVESGLPVTVVDGELCFFGKIPGTYAANFDVNGSYWCGNGEWD